MMSHHDMVPLRHATRKMTDSDLPLLVVVTGPPAAGKTTIAKTLSLELGLPCVSRDSFKEILFEELGWSDRAWSQRLGRATWPLLYHVVGEQLRAGRSLLVEANFDPALDAAEFARLPPFRAVQVYCTAPPETILERFAARARDGSRHPGHVDSSIAAEIAAGLDSERWAPLGLDGERLDVDTSTDEPVDAVAIAARIRTLAR